MRKLTLSDLVQEVSLHSKEALLEEVRYCCISSYLISTQFSQGLKFSVVTTDCLQLDSQRVSEVGGGRCGWGGVTGLRATG